MQGVAWTGLLARIPPEQHDCLVLMTNSGTEIVLQRLIRLEQDFLVAIGRLAGSTDQGKILVIPYDQLNYLSINKQLTDAQIESTLGKASAEANLIESRANATSGAPQPAQAEVVKPNATRASAPTQPAGQRPAEDNQKTVAEAPAVDKPGAKPDPKASPPSKTMLLARLRQRLAEGANKQPVRE